MAETIIEIPTTTLPIKEGVSLSSRLEGITNGIARIVISTEDKPKKKKKTPGQWMRENRGVFKGVEEYADEDPILEAILEKHAPKPLN